MNKAEFNAQVTALLSRAKKIGFDQYDKAIDVVDDFESFTKEHHQYFYNYITEEIDGIRNDFERMKKYKNSYTKREYYGSAIKGLEHDIESMLNNKVPE